MGLYTVFLRGGGFPVELLCLNNRNNKGTPEPCHFLGTEYYSTTDSRIRFFFTQSKE
jgi:hypothetical protein